MPAGAVKPSSAGEVALLEAPDHHAQGGAERDHVQQQRLERDQHRAGHEEQQHERREDHHPDRQRGGAAQLGGEVDEAGRLAGDPHPHVRPVRPQRAHDRGRLLAAGVGAVEPDAEVGEVAELGGRVDAADAGDVLDDVRRPALELVGDRRVGALRDDGDGRCRRVREVGALGGEELPLLVLDRQQVLGRAAHRQLQHGRGHQAEHHEHRDHHPPGVALDPAGEPAEEALVRRDVAETPHQRTDPGHPVQRARGARGGSRPARAAPAPG